MKKILILMFAFIIAFSFSSCSSGKNNTYIAEDGAEYMLVRDGEGSIVINENDKLQVYVLNENGKKQKTDAGEYITEYIDFNGQVVIGNTVETAEMRYRLPSGFVADSNNPGYFYYEGISAEIFFSYYGDSADTHMNAVAYNCEKLLESYGSEAFSYEKYDISVDGTDCTAVRMQCTSSEYYNHAYSYFIPYDTGCYYINCIVNTGNANKVDFDKFIKNIELK